MLIRTVCGMKSKVIWGGDWGVGTMGIFIAYSINIEGKSSRT